MTVVNINDILVDDPKKRKGKKVVINLGDILNKIEKPKQEKKVSQPEPLPQGKKISKTQISKPFESLQVTEQPQEQVNQVVDPLKFLQKGKKVTRISNAFDLEQQQEPDYYKILLDLQKEPKPIQAVNQPTPEKQITPVMPQAQDVKPTISNAFNLPEETKPDFNRFLIERLKKDLPDSESAISFIEKLQNTGNPQALLEEFKPENISEKTTKLIETVNDLNKLFPDSKTDINEFSEAVKNEPIYQQWKEVVDNKDKTPFTLQVVKEANAVVSTAFVPIMKIFELGETVPIIGEQTVNYAMRNFNIVGAVTSLISPFLNPYENEQDNKTLHEQLNSLIPIIFFGLENRLKGKGLDKKPVNSPEVKKAVEEYKKEVTETVIPEQIKLPPEREIAPKAEKESTFTPDYTDSKGRQWQLQKMEKNKATLVDDKGLEITVKKKTLDKFYEQVKQEEVKAPIQETVQEVKPTVQEPVKEDVTPTGIKEGEVKEIVPEGVSEVKQPVKTEPVKETKQEVKQPYEMTDYEQERTEVKRPISHKTWGEYDEWIKSKSDEFILQTFKDQTINEIENIFFSKEFFKPKLNEESKKINRINIASVYLEAKRRNLKIPSSQKLNEYLGIEDNVINVNKEIGKKNVPALKEPVKTEPVKETKQEVKQPQYSGEKLFPKILKEYKGDEYTDKVSGIKYKYKGEYIPEGKRKSTGYEYEPIYTEEMRKIRNEKLKGKVTEDLTPVEKIIVKEPRNEIPEAISEKVKEKAENLLKEVEDATVEKHGAYYNADLDKSTPAYTINTFPEWFRDLGMNKKNAINALRKIIIDKGQDKGVSVEKVKKIILEHLTQGRVDRDVSMVSGKRTSNKEYFTEAEDKQLSEFLKRFEKDEITIEEFDNAVKEMAKRDESFNAETIKQKKLADEVEKLYNEREELQSEIAKGDAFGKAEKELADVNKKITDIEKQLPEDTSFKFGKNVEEVKPETKKEPKPITYTKYAEAVKEKEKLQKQYEESGNETEIAGIEKRIKELDKQINEYETKQVKKGFISEPEKPKVKKTPEQKYVEEQIRNKNIKPAQKQAEKIKENKRQDKIEKKEAEFKRIKERLRELNDAVTRRSLKARKEKAELLERYGELKKELGIEDDMFSKKTDMFGEEKPEAFIKSKDKVKPKVQETVDFDINNVKTIREISMNFINGLDKIYGRSVRTGLVKRFNKKAEGLYFLANKIVRLKSINDIKTLAHEFGHVLDHEIFKYAEKYKLLDIKTRKLFKRELGNLSDYAMKFVKKGGKMHEPIAEFVRLYITEPDFVKKTAPNFYEFFENITKSNENIDGVLKEIRRQYKEYEAQDPRAKIESKIIRDTKEGILNGILPNLKKDKMVDFLIDHTKVFQKLSQQVIEMKDGIDKGKLVYYRMLSLLGVSGKAEAYLKFGEDNVKGFLEIIKEPIIKRQWKEHDGYMVALRNIELFKNGKEEAMTVDYETSLKAKELYEQQFGKEYLEKFQKQVLDYQNMILKKYYESGKLSTENYEKILEDNKYYIPFRRFFDEIETTGTYKLSNVLSDTSPSPVKVIRGSKREIYSPLESVIKNTYDILVSVDRNEVLRTLVENLKIIDTDLVQEIPSTVVKMKKTYDKDIEDYKIVPVFEKDRPVGKEIVSVWEEGVEKYYQIPKEYYDSYFTSQQPLGQFIKIFSIPTRLLQAGAVVYEPGFGFSNPFRDQTTAYMTSRYGYKPWLDFVKGMTHRLKKDAIYEKFMKSGAGMNFLTAIDEMMTKRYMEKKLGKHAEDYTKYAKRYLRNPLTALRDFNEMTESGTRIGAFERAYKKTGDVWLAMEEARQISGDYGVKGRGMRNVAPLFSFLNAKIQHAKLFFEVGEGERGSISSKMLKGMVGITLPAMLNWLYINTDDELRAEYDDLPEWRKYTCFNIPIPFTKTFMPIPKGSYGTLFGTTVEKLLDFAKHEDKYFVKDLLKYLFQEVSPISSIYEFIPTFARPIIEQIANTKSFQGTPIVPERLKDVQAKEQYTDFTPMVYRGLGKVLGLSPLRIETFVNGYLAGTGRNISGVMDVVGEKAGIFKDNDVSKFNILGFDLTKLPFTRRVLSDRYRGLRGEQLNIFYDELSKLESIHKTFKSYMDKEEYDKGKEYIEKNKDEYDFYIKNQTNLNKFKKFLVIARDIAFTEKDKADEINDIVFEVAKDFKKKMREGISFELNDKIIEILSKKKRTDKEQKEYEEEILNEFGIEKKKSKKSSGFDVENSGFK